MDRGFFQICWKPRLSLVKDFVFLSITKKELLLWGKSLKFRISDQNGCYLSTLYHHISCIRSREILIRLSYPKNSTKVPSVLFQLLIKIFFSLFILFCIFSSYLFMYHSIPKSFFIFSYHPTLNTFEAIIQ